MESDLFNGALPFPINFTTLSIALVILIATIAFLRGVIGMFVGLACMMIGVYCAYTIYPLLPEWLSHVIDNPSPLLIFSLTLGSAFCVYLFLRLLAGAFVLSPFRKKEKKRILRGPVGMVLSLIPATALIFVLGVALWTVGTLFSVEHTKEGVSVQPGLNAAQRPFWARWNYALERDWIGKVIGKIDPLSARAKGAISNFLVTLKDDSAGGELSKHPKISRVLRTPGLRDLADDPEVAGLIKDGDYIRLLNHPKIRATASAPKFNKLLDDLPVPVEEIVDKSLYREEQGLLVRRQSRLRLDP